MDMTGNTRLDNILIRANERVVEIIKDYEKSPQTAKLLGDILSLTIEFRTRECLVARKSECSEQMDKKYNKLIDADFDLNLLKGYTQQIQQIMTM